MNRDRHVSAGASKAPRRELRGLERRLGYRFRDPELLERALTHASYTHEASRAAHYERLEFLGDALLGLLVADWLFRADPRAPEGVLTRRKQIIVRAETLAEVSRTLGLGGLLRLGRGEEATGGREKPSILADVLEALVAAVYLDGGIRPARAFVQRHLGALMEASLAAREVQEDYKTRLQEQVQSRLRVTPSYRMVSVEGPPHERRFRAEVRVGEEVWGRGEGRSRKEAEQAAAKAALERARAMR